jgi:hypothetical protein
MKYIFSILITILIGLSSCEPKPIEMEIKMSAPKIVITPLFNSENELGVIVTRSFSSLESMEKDPFDLLYGSRVSSAKVSIENGGTVYELPGMSPFFLSQEISFRPYSEYTITVTDTANGETTKATTIMLPKANMDSLTLGISRRQNDTSLKLRISIDDAGSKRKYYLATFKLNQETGRKRTSNSLTRKSLYDMIELFDNSQAENGKVKYEKIFRQSLVEFRSNDSVVVDVSEVSEEYYNYLLIFKKTGSFINQLTGEPINFPSNVRGGAGFFFLLNPVYREFELANL